MNVWYIQIDEETESEPIRPSELLAMVRKGEITEQTKLRKGDSAWFEACKVGGLFEAASRPEIRHYCPNCSKPITKPPVECRSCGMDVFHSLQEEVPLAELADRSATAKRSIKGWLKKKNLK